MNWSAPEFISVGDQLVEMPTLNTELQMNAYRQVLEFFLQRQ